MATYRARISGTDCGNHETLWIQCKADSVTNIWVVTANGDYLMLLSTDNCVKCIFVNHCQSNGACVGCIWTVVTP